MADGNHGRIEARRPGREPPRLGGRAGRSERETRFNIISPTLPADRIGSIVRDHWAAETSLHWVMDIVFRDNECRLRTDQATANSSTIKHVVPNLMGICLGKDSLRLRRKVAARADTCLASLIAR
jgi:hypothetical protein